MYQYNATFYHLTPYHTNGMRKFDFKNGSNIIKRITQSATFALLLSFAFFAYEMSSGAKETKEVVDNLEKIQNSLSTRYLGLFPEYISNINLLLNDAINHKNNSELRDSIIIFEDVLYYGIRSDAKGFRKMMENLLTLTDNGCHVTIAFYNVDGIPFKQMIRDKLLTYEYQNQYRSEMRSYYTGLMRVKRGIDSIDSNLPRNEYDNEVKSLINRHFNKSFITNVTSEVSLRDFYRNIDNRQRVDSIITQRYYEYSRDANHREFASSVKSMQRTLPQETDSNNVITLQVNKLCSDLDSIIGYYFDKPIDDITYSDYYNMYKNVTLTIYNVLQKQPNIELIPLNESIMMCCWMSTIDGESNAIFAFPSKYSTDEIGFTSRDDAIVRYIHTMLDGIKGNLSHNSN